ncbi:MAG: phosphotransferase [Candidatus Levybacteria bacterium]|nr:phosphotransferase [Candidatus Levybacteria bacterium]
MQLQKQLEKYYGITNAICVPLDTLANYAISVTTPTGRFALKLYNPASRTAAEVQWEIELTLHLLQKGVPVAKPVRSKNGYVETIQGDGLDRTAVLFAWAPGEKPQAGPGTYILLGKAAAQIHQAADGFTSLLSREKYDVTVLIDEQLQLMKDPLIESNQWSRVKDLGNRMKQILANPHLDRGVCHMDLTLDNIHIDGDRITVFDFDSAGESFRAIEPYGVLKFSEKYFKSWLEGYRSIRTFSMENEKAVYAFVIIGELRNVVWKLGLARSSRGKPLIDTSYLPGIVDEWLAWEHTHLPSSVK